MNYVIESFPLWQVYIPPTLTDALHHDQLDSLISALHDGGATETESYTGLVATYANAETQEQAEQDCLSTLREFFPDFTFTRGPKT